MNMLLKRYETRHIRKFIDDIRYFHNYLFANYPVLDDDDIEKKKLILDELGNYVKLLSVAVESFENKTMTLKELKTLTFSTRASYDILIKSHAELSSYVYYPVYSDTL